jgi:hypothetical protein
MATKENKELAFPTCGIQYTTEGKSWATGGMTLRDYFAAKAMQGELANEAKDWKGSYQYLAKRAYVIADAMLEARGA